MNARQILLVVLVLVCLGVVISLIGNATAGSYKPIADPPRIDPMATDDDSKKVTINWMARPYWPTASKGTWVEQDVERRFNVEFNPTFLDPNGYGTKRPLLFCGSGAPDAWWEPNPVTLQKYVQNGFVAEVPYELIKRYAPTYVRYMNEYAPVAWLYCRVNGKNYGVPTMFLAGRYPPCGVWRKDWLRKVGIQKIPDTLDEMHEALYRFRHNDPDGNGKMDTYGMTGYIVSWHSYLNEIYGAYGVAPYDWMLRDGKVVWGGCLPETKRALSLLRQWYKEGLIDPDFVIDTGGPGGSIETKFLSGKIGYEDTLGQDYLILHRDAPTGFASRFYKLNPKGELAPAMFPKGPGGLRGFRVWGSGGNITTFGADVAKHPEKCIRILKIMEAASANVDLALEMASGKRGVHWEFKDTAPGYRGRVVGLPPYDSTSRAATAALTFTVGGENIGGAFSEATTSPEIADTFLPPEAVAYRDKYRNEKYGILDILGKADVVPSSGVYLADLRSLQIMVFADIIRGAKPLSAFDDFVAEWRRRGGDKMTAEATQMQREKLEIYRKMGIGTERRANGKAD